MIGEPCRVPDLTEEVIGYRYFGLHGGKLRSVAQQYIYKPGLQTCECSAGYMRSSGMEDWHAETPSWRCGCGFYSWYDAERAREQYRTYPVMGVVANSGRILPFTRGMRSEHTRILALAMGDTPASRRERYYLSAGDGFTKPLTRRDAKKLRLQLALEYDCTVFKNPDALVECVNQWVAKGIVHELPAKFRKASREEAQRQRYKHPGMFPSVYPGQVISTTSAQFWNHQAQQVRFTNPFNREQQSGTDG